MHAANPRDSRPAMDAQPAMRDRFEPVEPAQQRGPPPAVAPPTNGMRTWGAPREPPAAAQAPRDVRVRDEYHGAAARDDRRPSASRLSREPDAPGAYGGAQRSQEPSRSAEPRRDYPSHDAPRAAYGPRAQEPPRAISPRDEFAPRPAREAGPGAPRQYDQPRGLDSQRDYRAAPPAAYPPRDVDRRAPQQAPMREWGAPREHSSDPPAPPQQHAPRDVSGDMRSLAEREAALARKERELQERERAIQQATASVPRR